MLFFLLVFLFLSVFTHWLCVQAFTHPVPLLWAAEAQLSSAKHHTEWWLQSVSQTCENVVAFCNGSNFFALWFEFYGGKLNVFLYFSYQYCVFKEEEITHALASTTPAWVCWISCWFLSSDRAERHSGISFRFPDLCTWSRSNQLSMEALPLIPSHFQIDPATHQPNVERTTTFVLFKNLT